MPKYNKPAVSKVAVTVIAIDGPSGSGKGTIARRVADALGFHLLDSGALYRLTAISASKQGVALDDVEGLAAVAHDLDVEFDSSESGEERIRLGGIDVTREVRKESTGTQARHKQLKDKGIDVSLAALSRDIEDRDQAGFRAIGSPVKACSGRPIAGFQQPDDRIEVTQTMVLDWVARTLKSHANRG